MNESASAPGPIRDLLDGTRSRWRRLTWLRAIARAALAATAPVLVLAVGFWVTRSPLGLAVTGLLGSILAVGAAVSALWGARERPTDARLARFIEERVPELDDRLVSAVHLTAGDADSPALAPAMLADAARAVAGLQADALVPDRLLRRAGFQALGAVLLLGAALFFSRGAVQGTVDALSLTLFPARIAVEVSPGDARIRAGSSVTIEARLVGNRAPVVATLLRGDEAEWQAQEMGADGRDRFVATLESVAATFRYRIAAGAVRSPTYTITVVKPPRVKRIDVEYTYPKGLGLEPRLEEDGGDIYAPEGTNVRVRVYTDRPAANGRLVMASGEEVALALDSDGGLAGPIRVVADGSYRVTVADAEGLTSRGDTEYFIRTLEDRPPDVHVTRPARDRRVTRLEEVDVEVEAHDDFGIERVDLVYAVRGRAEHVVPLIVPPGFKSVSGRRTLYLEDLDVEPGDFVTYYARARDQARGKRSSEARSDIFFLEVRPFEEEFTLAESQAGGGGSDRNRHLDDLVAAEKEIIVATWKLDRRSRMTGGSRSEQDIKTVASAQSELKTRVQEVASAFRTSAMRDPRRRSAGRGRGGPPQTLPGAQILEEDAMTAAANAMGKAATSLNGLRTAEALPFEMEALNDLLRAQAEVKKRQVQRQQAGQGAGGNRSDVDLSTLFDRELARQQQTNYETPSNAERTDAQAASALDDIKDLARRQDELLQRQRDVARDRDRMSPEELKRELEKLTREQNDLRQRADDLQRRMAQVGQVAQVGQQGQAGQGGQPGKAGAGPQGRGVQAGQPGNTDREGRGGPAGQRSDRSGQGPGEMRGVSDDMRGAANDLRRQDASAASERAARALDKLRELERTLQASSPDARRRALGDLQLEARQLADAERQVAAEAARALRGTPNRDALRRLSGEQSRLADRARRVQEGLKGHAATGGSASFAGSDPGATRLFSAAAEGARDLEQSRVAQRIDQSAAAMRAEAERSASANGEPGRLSAAAAARSGSEVARKFDELADKLASADAGFSDNESRRLSGQLTRTRELRDRLAALASELDALSRASAGGKGGQAASGQPSDASRLSEQATRELQEVRELLDQLQAEDKDHLLRGGRGLTFDAPGRMVLSAPGTEAFKQDFARWQELNKQASSALDQAETALTGKLTERQSKARLAAGVDDKAPPEYQRQVDSYFKALAGKRK